MAPDDTSPRPPVPEGRPVETRPVETRPVETRPVETRPVETRPVDSRPITPLPSDGRPGDTKAASSGTTKSGSSGSAGAGSENRPVQARTRRRRRARIIAPVRRGLGLRTRLTLTYGLGAAMLAAVMSITTFGLTRENLMTQREESSVARAVANAARVASQLPNGAGSVAVEKVLTGLPTPEGAQPVLHYQGQWYATNTIDFGERAIPDSLKAMVDGGQPARLRHLPRRPLPRHRRAHPLLGAEYYEGVSLADLERTLDGLAISLLGASALTTLAGGLVGFWASRRVLRPAARRRPGRRGHRRGAPRHPPPRRRRPRPRPDRRAVQRDGPGPRGPHRARRPVRLRGQPRAPLTAHDAGRHRRGARELERGDARARPHRARCCCRPTSTGSSSWSRTCSRSPGSTWAPSSCTSRRCWWPRWSSRP